MSRAVTVSEDLAAVHRTHPRSPSSSGVRLGAAVRWDGRGSTRFVGLAIVGVLALLIALVLLLPLDGAAEHGCAEAEDLMELDDPAP